MNQALIIIGAFILLRVAEFFINKGIERSKKTVHNKWDDILFDVLKIIVTVIGGFMPKFGKKK